LGSSRCLGCNQQVGYGFEANTEAVDASLVNQATLFQTLEREAMRSYVWMDIDFWPILPVRGINPSIKAIGSIIIHVLLFIPLIFGNGALKQRVS
jgi:hypothetical protein